MPKFNFEVVFDGSDPEKPAHIYEIIGSGPGEPTALCGAPRPAREGTPPYPEQRPNDPTPMCETCETILNERGEELFARSPG